MSLPPIIVGKVVLIFILIFKTAIIKVAVYLLMYKLMLILLILGVFNILMKKNSNTLSQ